MASTTLFQNSIRLAASVLHWWSLPIMLMIASTFWTPSVSGEPVTLRFEAEIGSVIQGISFDSVIDFAVGDVITGQFTFDPAEGGQNMLFTTIQPYSFQIAINETELASTSFELTADDDDYVFDFDGGG